MDQSPLKRYTFDTEFFEMAPPPGGTRSATSLTRVAVNPKQKAFDEGYAKGVADGTQRAQAEVAQLTAHLQKVIDSLQQTMHQREQQLLTQTLALMRASLLHVVGDLVRYYPDELLENHLRTVLPLIKGDEALTLRVNPQARTFHEKLQLPHASILGLPMHIVADPSLGATDALVEWRNGGVECKLEEHLKEISRLLAAANVAMLPTPPLPQEVSPVSAGGASLAQPGPSPAAVGAAGAATDAPLSSAATAVRSRAAELLGDDDLVDALKN